jgi:hypothetical protein
MCGGRGENFDDDAGSNISNTMYKWSRDAT